MPKKNRVTYLASPRSATDEKLPVVITAEMASSMPIEAVEDGLRGMGLDPDQPLPAPIKRMVDDGSSDSLGRTIKWLLRIAGCLRHGVPLRKIIFEIQRPLPLAILALALAVIPSFNLINPVPERSIDQEGETKNFPGKLTIHPDTGPVKKNEEEFAKRETRDREKTAIDQNGTVRNQPPAMKLRSTKQDREIESGNGTLGPSFESRRIDQIEQLPLNARNVVGLLSLQTGVTRGGSVNGGRADQANVMLNGVDVNEQQVNSDVVSALTLSPNPAPEQSIVTNDNNDVGTITPPVRLDVKGDIHVSSAPAVDGNISAKYQDVAELVTATQEMAAGTVVVLDKTRPNTVVPSARAYDTRLAGVVLEQPGLVLDQAGERKVMVATTGRVKVRVDATRWPIRVGDLLVTSEVEGVAMRSVPVMISGRQFHAPGTIIGKALEPLAHGTGEILVLLSLQ